MTEAGIPKRPKIMWDCGCLTFVIDDVFYIRPCSKDCQVYKIAIEESKKRGNEILEMTDEDMRRYLIENRPNLPPPKYRWRRKSGSIRE